MPVPDEFKDAFGAFLGPALRGISIDADFAVGDLNPVAEISVRDFEELSLPIKESIENCATAVSEGDPEACMDTAWQSLAAMECLVQWIEHEGYKPSCITRCADWLKKAIDELRPHVNLGTARQGVANIRLHPAGIIAKSVGRIGRIDFQQGMKLQ
jgi:hypothetical protein